MSLWLKKKVAYLSMSEVAARVITASRYWRNTCLFACCSLFALASLYRSTLLGMVELWHTSTFSHGFLVVPIALYLVWVRRRDLSLTRPTPTGWPLLLLAAFALGWVAGAVSETDVVKQFCVIAMVIVMIWAIVGNSVARTIRMPLMFLFFAVPLGASLIPALQDFSAWFAVKLLDLSHIPVLLEGRFISVPSGRWEVAEACSGIRFLIASLAVAFLYAGLMYRSWFRRLAFVSASAVVPIFANSLRVYGIILLGYVSGNRIAVGVDHIIYGWIFFTIVTALLISIGLLWREKLADTEVTLGTRQSLSAAEAPFANEHGGFRFPRPSLVVATALFIVTFAPTTLWLSDLWARQNATPSIQARFAHVSPPWTIATDDDLNWKPHFAAASAEQMVNYRSGGQLVRVYVAYYAPGAREGAVVASANVLYNADDWWRLGEAQTSVLVGTKESRVHATFIRSQGRSLILWNWYWIEGQVTDNDYLAKALVAKERLSGKHLGSAAIVIATDGQPDDAGATLTDFLRHMSF